MINSKSDTLPLGESETCEGQLALNDVLLENYYNSAVLLFFLIFRKRIREIKHKTRSNL